MANHFTPLHHKYISHCFYLQPIPSSLIWKDEYAANKETSILVYHLIHHQPFDENTLSSLPVKYRRAITDNTLGIVENRVVFYESVPKATNKNCHIVIPISPWHTIFFLLHTSPATGHVGEYKTLYRIKLRFFWSKIRSEIHRWIK